MTKKIFMDLKHYPPEIESGHIEYKLKIDYIRKETLSSQLVWRINEGFRDLGIYRAKYIIGINDDGSCGHQKIEVIRDSIKNLSKLAEYVYSKIIDVKIINYCSGSIAEVLIEKKLDIKQIKEYRVMFLGQNNSGKSTLISCLKNNILDNGNGYARKFILRHKHEKITGKTSSISYETLKLKNNKRLNDNYDDFFCDEINEYDTLLHLIDTYGDKYKINNLFYYIETFKPNLVILTFSSDMFIDYKENDKFNSLLNIYDYYNKISKFLDFLNINYILCCNKEINNFNKKINSILSNHFYKNPIFFTNCCKSDSIDNLLQKIIKNVNKEEQIIKNKFIIYESFFNKEIGLIVSGLSNMKIKIKEKYFIVNSNGDTEEVKIESIHKNKEPVSVLFKDEIGTILIKFIKNKYDNFINNNLFLIPKELKKFLTNEFTIYVKQPDFFKKNYTYKVYFENTKEIVRIKNISGNIVKGNFLNSKKKLIDYEKNVLFADTHNKSNILFGKFILK